MKVVSIKCPECGATLDVEEGRTQIFCSYCGSKVLIQNENEHIIRHIDDAEVKRAETDRMVKSKQIELTEQLQAASLVSKAKNTKILAILFAVGGVFLCLGFLTNLEAFYGIGLLAVVAGGWLYMTTSNKKEEDVGVLLGEKAIVPDTVYECEKKTYTVIEESFVAAGFTNVKSVAMNDLSVGVLKKPGFVESVTVSGKKAYRGDAYPKDAPVIISYHSKK